MRTLRDFKLETYFTKWEFNAKYHMTASDAESMLLSDLNNFSNERGLQKGTNA